MSSLTPNYNFILPAVNSPVDEDLWGDELNDNWESLDTLLKTATDRATYPVGSLYFNAAVATNPATLLGYGTWVAYGEGRVLIGVGSGTDANGTVEAFALGDTGGEYTHTLTAAEVPELDGVVDGATAQGSGGGNSITASGTGSGTLGVTVNSSGGDPHINKQPYIALYIWRRSA